MKDGKPHGFGRKYLRGAIYEGQFEEGAKDGWGRLIYANGTYYVGYFKDDMMDGIGRLACCTLRMGKLQKYHDNSGNFDEFNMKTSYTFKEGEFQMGSLVSLEIDNYIQCMNKIRKADELKHQY